LEQIVERLKTLSEKLLSLGLEAVEGEGRVEQGVELEQEDIDIRG
jgi:hypothetical protein